MTDCSAHELGTIKLRGPGGQWLFVFGLRFFLRSGLVLRMNPLVGVAVGAILGSAQEAIVHCTKPLALAGHRPTWLVSRC